MQGRPKGHTIKVKRPHNRCDLCGLPVRGSQTRYVVDGKARHFCCPGCHHVFQILANRFGDSSTDFKETDLYRACVSSGIIPQNGANQGPEEIQETRHSQAALLSQPFREDHSQELTLRVEGMWCISCSWLVEEVLRRTEGIIDATVFFHSDAVQLKYLPQFLTPQEIMAKIASLGYRAAPLDDRTGASGERRDLLIRLGISAFLTANIMMISLALYAGFFQALSSIAILYFSLPLFALATPVIFYGGFPILKRAWCGLRFWNVSMDTLISIGALSAYVYSIIQMARGSIHIYFDTASMLVTLVLLGRYIETRAKEKASEGFIELYRLTNQKARLWGSNKETWVSPEAVKEGDEFLVMEGERIPIDGQIVSGRAEVDESILTGESKPAKRESGDDVLGGTLVLDGKLRLRATRIGRESSLGQMIELMEEALTKKEPVELFADRITAWFVPAILALAGGTALYLLFHNVPVEVALLRAVTVLVIACPCALGIATPLAKVASMTASRARGILIRDPVALERARDLNAVVFDKTGTMTEGSFQLREIFSPGINEKLALGRVASLEVHSDHLLARTTVRTALEASLEMERVTSFEAVEGRGVRGVVRGTEILVGNRQFMGEREMTLPQSVEENARGRERGGATVVFFGWHKLVQGFLTFGDALKENAQNLVLTLKSKGILTCLVSGDGEETTQAVAERLRVDKFFGQALPIDKGGVIKNLQNKGFRVGMVGDGVNDAAALAQSDVGFALGRRSNIAQDASDVNIVTDDPTRVLDVFTLSASTMRIIRQNLFFACFYNALAIPMAAAGTLSPLVAVIAMFASSLTVIGNTLRISRRHG